jgi:putative phosphoesterase
VGGLVIHVSHGHEVGVPTPEKLAARYPSADVLVYGHTHRAKITRIGERLVVNPGSAGPARFDTEPSVARLTVQDGLPQITLVRLDDP